MVTRLQRSDVDARRAGMEKLCRRYWKPVYRYARVAWAKTIEDAKDLTQAFFLWLLSGEVLAKYAADRGRFRAYLKGVLRKFVADRHKALEALKRGGGLSIVPLGDLDAPTSDDPDREFDAAWKKEILDAALDRTRRGLASEGRELQFQVFEAYDLVAPDTRPTQKELAERFGIKTTDVANHLFAVRQRLRSEAQSELSETVTDLDELREEWNELIGG